MDKELLEILADPETKEDLVLADPAILTKVNGLIEKGAVINRSGQPVTEKMDEGLVGKNAPKYLYPVREGIPVMLIDESIPLENLS